MEGWGSERHTAGKKGGGGEEKGHKEKERQAPQPPETDACGDRRQAEDIKLSCIWKNSLPDTFPAV